jgi:predicted RNA methylase
MNKLTQQGLHRNTIDKFYTKTRIAKLCVDKIPEYISIGHTELIIEPSAGNGSFIDYIKQLSAHYTFYDLEPEHPEIMRQDFLHLNYIELKQKFTNIHIIGNPPFGRQSSTAIKFIKKCCLFSSSISFILPKSFKKQSMRKYFEKHYHLLYEMDLEHNSFLLNGIETNVPCIFQIWKYKNKVRIDNDKLEPKHFKFVKKKIIRIFPFVE